MVGLSCFNIRLLKDMCVKIACQLNMQVEFEILPNSLKNAILSELTKRGKANGNILKQLVNESIIKIDLSNCDITNSLLHNLIYCINLKELVINSIRGHRYDVQDADLKVVFDNLKTLQYVQLCRCVNVTDNCIERLLKNNQNLQMLNLCGCSQITNKTLESISRYSSKLIGLFLERTKVTHEGILYLIKSKCIDHLKELKLDGCINISHESINKIEKNCPNLTALSYSNGRLIRGDMFW